jgi:hypothetical protein
MEIKNPKDKKSISPKATGPMEKTNLLTEEDLENLDESPENPYEETNEMIEKDERDEKDGRVN